MSFEGYNKIELHARIAIAIRRNVFCNLFKTSNWGG